MHKSLIDLEHLSKLQARTSKVKLPEGWKQVLSSEFSKPYMQRLRTFLLEQKKIGKIIYPSSNNIFNAFQITDYNKVKVVLLGQDPYHGPQQAHGLSFSVLPGVKLPKSLINIYRELEEDLGIAPSKHGCLLNWANQGVLLLNSVLTVEAGQAGSHREQGWERFTDAVISCLNAREQPLIFVLWGNYAAKKCQFIDMQKHKVLLAPHPSPLSAHRGFFGCKHFSKINQILKNWKQKPINWQL